MIQLRQWPPRNSTLWRVSAAFWLLNAAFNGVTACVSTTPSVYLALGGINIFLAALRTSSMSNTDEPSRYRELLTLQGSCLPRIRRHLN